MLRMVGKELHLLGGRYPMPLPEPLWPDTTERLALKRHLDLLDQAKTAEYYRDPEDEDEDDGSDRSDP